MTGSCQTSLIFRIYKRPLKLQLTLPLFIIGKGYSSISAETYTTTNDITDPPTSTFSTNPTLQESSESFTTRVSSDTTTSGDFLSSSKLFPVDSATDIHHATQTVLDDVTGNGNVSTAKVDIHSTDSATDKTNSISFVSTDSAITLSHSGASIKMNATEPTNSQNDSTTPIQNFNTSTESTNNNISLNHHLS